MISFVVCFSILAAFGVRAANESQFEKLYDYYFPKNDKYQNGFYRRGFDATIFDPSSKSGEDRHKFYYAFRGDVGAFHIFVRHPDRDGEGEFTLTWIKESLVLLLRLGDDDFSKLLAREDKRTREVVGAAIDQQIDWTKHDFPKTRALYSYRYILPSHQVLEKKHGNGLSRLIASLAKEKRFSGVRVYNRSDERGSILVTAPKSLPDKDKVDLKRRIQQHLGGDASVTFE